jgi:hypothetical protein
LVIKLNGGRQARIHLGDARRFCVTIGVEIERSRQLGVGRVVRNVREAARIARVAFQNFLDRQLRGLARVQPECAQNEIVKATIFYEVVDAPDLRDIGLVEIDLGILVFLSSGGVVRGERVDGGFGLVGRLRRGTVDRAIRVEIEGCRELTLGRVGALVRDAVGIGKIARQNVA